MARSDIVMIANAWGAGEANPTSKHHLARCFAARGRRVLWIEGAGMRRPSLGSGSDRSRMRARLAAARRGAVPAAVAGGAAPIDVLTPLFLPLPALAPVRRLNGWMAAAAARRWSRRLGLRAPVLVNYVPVLGHAFAHWRGPKLYHCVDRWDAFRMYDSAMMAHMDAVCCRRADLVVASARDLAERCRRHNTRVYEVSHGVEVEHFRVALDARPLPADLPQGPVVGFFGLLSEWFDQDLVLAVARALPHVPFALIGAADVDVGRLDAAPNLHRLGPRPFQSLPDYARGFRAGIIPFVVNDLTRSVNPVKLREMLAAGCPVVSTPLPEVAPYARDRAGLARPAVRLAADAAAFAAALREWIEVPADADERRAISASVADETWTAKADAILRLLDAEGKDPT